MPERRKMTDAARQFLETGEVSAQTLVSVAEDKSNKVKGMSSLKAELLGESIEAEATIRFTVDLPRSLNQRLVRLSQDSQKPKTELARTILERVLDDLGY